MRSKSWLVALTLAVIASPASAATLFADDVEAGTGGWTATGLWHRVAAGDACNNAHGGSASWYYGSAAASCTYDTGATNSGTLTSAPFVVPALGSTWAEFWSYYQTESSGTAWDQRIVQVSVDGGGFTNLRQLSGDPMSSWQWVRIDLTAYAGHTLRVRFFFDTRDPVANRYAGWYLDDLSVVTAPPQFVPAPATYGWIDIAAPGNNTGIACDDCQATGTIGFPFSFYGTTYGTVNISSNGFVTFAGNAVTWGNSDLPSTSLPNALAAPFWDDLYVGGAARVYAATVGTAPNRKYVVTWQAVDFCCSIGSGPLTFQLVLSESDNSIVFQYAAVEATGSGDRGRGSSATVGVENQAGTVGVRHSFDQPVLSNGLALRFLLDSDADGVSDLDEGIIGTNPHVSDVPPILIVLSGPGTTTGTAYFQFLEYGAVSGATAYRVYYGPASGAVASDYPMHFDITDTSQRGGVIDQRWGMQGVPLVHFRVAPVKVVAGRAFVGELSNEHGAYFAEKSTLLGSNAGTTTTTTSSSSGCSAGGADVLGLLLAAAALPLRRLRRRGTPAA